MIIICGIIIIIVVNITITVCYVMAEYFWVDLNSYPAGWHLCCFILINAKRLYSSTEKRPPGKS